jgi:hypothetical protein
VKVYIPCFFNSIKEREDRFCLCLNQYIKLGYEVVIYWMNDFDIYIKHKNIKFIKAEQQNASYARNKLLDLFYNSKDEFAIISDDDVFLKEIVIPKIDCESFTNDFYEYSKETYLISSSFLVLKNIKPRLYFDESLYANQDLDFGINLKLNGFKSYRTSTKKVEIFRGASSMFENGADKIYKKQKTLIQIKNKYSNENI